MCLLKKEKIAYSSLGNIYPGDYYPEVPYHEYLSDSQPVPEDLSVFDIRNYGAVPGNLLNTEPIRLACEACRDAGGGIVLVDGGCYRSGTIRLYSHTTLFIASGSTLMASRNPDDLIFKPEGTQDFGDESSGGSFLLAMDAENICRQIPDDGCDDNNNK